MNTSLAPVFMDCRDKPGNDTESKWGTECDWRAIPDTAATEANRGDDEGGATSNL